MTIGPELAVETDLRVNPNAQDDHFLDAATAQESDKRMPAFVQERTAHQDDGGRDDTVK